MKFYDKYVLPSLINWVCGMDNHLQQRKKVVPFAAGKVLEIGIGPGLNLSIYDSEKVQQLIGIDPFVDTWKKGVVDESKLPFQFEFIKASAEELPFNDDAFDMVVVTYSLCTIPDGVKALKEMNRVLKPNGQLLFCEHGMAPDKGVARVQNIVNPVWKQFAGGCNLNKNIPQMIKDGGFEITKLDTMYIPGWKAASYNYWGTAKPSLI